MGLPLYFYSSIALNQARHFLFSTSSSSHSRMLFDSCLARCSSSCDEPPARSRPSLTRLSSWCRAFISAASESLTDPDSPSLLIFSSLAIFLSFAGPRGMPGYARIGACRTGIRVGLVLAISGESANRIVLHRAHLWTRFLACDQYRTRRNGFFDSGCLGTVCRYETCQQYGHHHPFTLQHPSLPGSMTRLG